MHTIEIQSQLLSPGQLRKEPYAAVLLQNMTGIASLIKLHLSLIVVAILIPIMVNTDWKGLLLSNQKEICCSNKQNVALTVCTS